jgi:hypothetical protein
MSRRNPLVVPAIVLGILFLVVAAIYFVESASSLPSFFPGHTAGSSHHHFKHGLLAAVLGIGCLLYAWFQTGPAARRPAA